MLQIAILKADTAKVKEQLLKKNFKEIDLVDSIIALDDARKQTQLAADTLQSNINAASKAIGKHLQQGEKATAETLKNDIATYKTEATALNQKLSDLEKALHTQLVKLPNLPHNAVAAGTSPADNEIVEEKGDKPVLSTNALPHWDLIEKYQLIDFELGSKITGRGFPLFQKQGAKLQRALVQFFLEHNIQAGYTEYLPPLMVNEASAFATGQLPDKEGQMYFVGEDNFYLIPTAEVPITNIYRDVIVKETDLPIQMTAYSACFRREAGSFGKDVRGLNRVHQFDKVEIIQLVKPEESYIALEAMRQHIAGLLDQLELPYRVLRLCGGDLGFASALTYDFEVWSAAQERWLEVSSVSNFETFQTHRLKTRYKNETGKIQLLHSLNGSALALPRIIAALLENNQTLDGIKIPAALQPYFGKSFIQ